MNYPEHPPAEGLAPMAALPELRSPITGQAAPQRCVVCGHGDHQHGDGFCVAPSALEECYCHGFHAAAEPEPEPEGSVMRGLLVGVAVSLPLWLVAFMIVRWVGQQAGWW